MMSEEESELAKATRRSIKKNFPLGIIMSKGRDNPITLHSVNDELFARVWSVIAEIMCVTGELSRTTKEAVAARVSEANACPVCIAAHTMMNVISIEVDNQQVKTKEEDEKKEKMHKQALLYTDMLLEEMNGHKRDNESHASSASSIGSLCSSGGSISALGSGGTKSNSNRSGKKSRRGKKLSQLNSTAKAEVALVVMLFDHMNRVVSVIMGEEMSTAMFSVPRAMAKAMEKTSTIKTISKFLSPLLSGSFKTKPSPGMTLSLFPEEGNANLKNRNPLPAHLQGIFLAGLERANAVARLVDWVETFEQETLIGQNILTENLIAFVEQQCKKSHPRFQSPGKVAKWVEQSVCDEARVELDDQEQEIGKTTAVVLLLSSFAPQTAYQSKRWEDLVEHLGEDTARSILVWWSLRCTLKDAKGLDAKIDAKTMVNLLNGAIPSAA